MSPIRNGWSVHPSFHQAVRRSRFWLAMLALAAAVVASLYLITGAGQTQETTRVSLDERVALPPVQQMGDVRQGQQEQVLRVAIAGVISPTRTTEHYQELLHYMGEKLGKEVRLILKPSYAEINDLVKGGRVDLAFVCSLAYCQGYHDFGMELLVAPQMYGNTVYYSYLIVPTDSLAAGLEDLKGRSFAFSDPLSNSGYLAPSYQLSLVDENPTFFFSRYTFTYSHDNSIMAVADRLVDGAAVDSLVYDQLIARDPVIASKTKVIARWGPYGIPPVVVNPNLDPELKQRLRQFFLDLHESPEGQAMLKNLNIDRFVNLTHDAYASIVEMKDKLGR